MPKTFIFLLLTFILGACDLNSTNQTTISTGSVLYSITGKWFFHTEDDRYYYDFRSDGTVYYKDFQVTPAGFITRIGHWTYRNGNQSSFSVGWDDSVDFYYNILDCNSSEMNLEKDLTGPMGRGLGSVVKLYRSATSISYLVPDEIAELMSTWYYDLSKTGKSLSFSADGTCTYHYYQSLGGNLSGWVNKSGIWVYSTQSKCLSITISGEVSYSYSLATLTSSELAFSLLPGNPDGKSAMYTANVLYK